jgi:ribosomal-protein-serine acetyltransferase
MLPSMPLPNHPVPTSLDAFPLSLRPWHEDHAPALHEAVQESLADMSPWLSWCRADYGLHDALQRVMYCKQSWDTGERYAFAVFDAQDRLVGGVGLNEVDQRNLSANLGYWVRRSANGQGYAACAARATAVFGFQTLGLRRIEISAAVSNIPSQRCAERIGARREGIARHRICVNGQSQDAVVYGLLPDDLA